jgi:hypothetical protein
VALVGVDTAVFRAFGTEGARLGFESTPNLPPVPPVKWTVSVTTGDTEGKRRAFHVRHTLGGATGWHCATLLLPEEIGQPRSRSERGGRWR